MNTISQMMNSLKVDVSEGRCGKWEIKHKEITQKEVKFETMRNALSGSNRGYTPSGIYTILYCGKEIVMSDIRDEIYDNYGIFHHAKGRVLVNGLGLGVVLEGLLRLGQVEHITVIEKSADVLTLTAEHYQKKGGSKLTIIHADAFTWQPAKGIRYGAVWHDIWPTLCADHLPDMHKLHRKYGRRCDWQGSWCRAEMEQHKKAWG